MSEKVAQMAKKLEERLYRSALTKAEYVDQSTLKKRLQTVLQQLQQQQQQESSSGGDQQQSQRNSMAGGMQQGFPQAPSPSISMQAQAVGSGQQPQPQMNQSGGAVAAANMIELLKKQGIENIPAEKLKQLQQLKARGLVSAEALASLLKGQQQKGGGNGGGASAMSQLQNNWRQASQGSQEGGGNDNASIGGDQGSDILSDMGASSGGGESSSSSTSAQKKKVIRQQQQRLVLLRHASKCTAGPSCPTKFCPQMVNLWTHMKRCRDKGCRTPHCLSSRRVLNHFRVCKAENRTASCEICAPVMKYIQAQSANSSGSGGGGGGSANGEDIDALATSADAVGSMGGDDKGDGKKGATPSDAQSNQAAVTSSSGGGDDTSQGNQPTMTREEAQQKLQQGMLLLRQLQTQQAQLMEQQSMIQQEQKNVMPNTPQGQQLQQKHMLLQKLQEEFRQQQRLLEQELKQRTLAVQQQGQVGVPDGATSSSSVAGADRNDTNKVASGSKKLNPNEKRNRREVGGKGKRLSKMHNDRVSSDDVKSAALEEKASSKRPATDNLELERPSKTSKTGDIPSISEKGDDPLLANGDATSDPLGPVALGDSPPPSSSGKGSGDKLSSSDISSKFLPLVRKLINDECGWVFSTPVDPVELGLPDYFEIIKNPMDLGTVESNLQSGSYDDVEKLERDVKLVFENSILYNGEGSDVGEMAKQMMDKFTAEYEAAMKASKK